MRAVLVPIVGTDSLEIHLRTGGGGVVAVRLLEMEYVPGLSYHVTSLRLIADASNCYTGTSESITKTFPSLMTKSFPQALGS